MWPGSARKLPTVGGSWVPGNGEIAETVLGVPKKGHQAVKRVEPVWAQILFQAKQVLKAVCPGSKSWPSTGHTRARGWHPRAFSTKEPGITAQFAGLGTLVQAGLHLAGALVPDTSSSQVLGGSLWALAFVTLSDPAACQGQFQGGGGEAGGGRLLLKRSLPQLRDGGASPSAPWAPSLSLDCSSTTQVQLPHPSQLPGSSVHSGARPPRDRPVRGLARTSSPRGSHGAAALTKKASSQSGGHVP